MSLFSENYLLNAMYSKNDGLDKKIKFLKICYTIHHTILKYSLYKYSVDLLKIDFEFDHKYIIYF